MIYEILYIIPSKFSDSEIDGVMETVTKQLETTGAKVEKTQNLGKIKLAYLIKTVSHGTYVLTYISGEGLDMKKIDQDLRLSDQILRHVIVKREKGIPVYAFRMSTYQEPLTPEGKRATGKKSAKREQVVAPEKTLSTEDLDKRLDQILEQDLTNL